MAASHYGTRQHSSPVITRHLFILGWLASTAGFFLRVLLGNARLRSANAAKIQDKSHLILHSHIRSIKLLVTRVTAEEKYLIDISILQDFLIEVFCFFQLNAAVIA